ncbi:MAG: hypothetical protein D6753_18030 [Planctomycetota bacterium]|nr:MAG: hypothetical protein D6753_18030 [Planctomycetota bacterium]
MQRLAKVGEQMQAELEELDQVWKDDVGRTFAQRHLNQVAPTIGQLVNSLAGQIEMAERIMEQIRDPDAP